MKKVLFFVLIILVSGFFIWPNIPIVKATATHTVCPAAGPGCEFTNIETAYNDASVASGDTLSIAAGTYTLSERIELQNDKAINIVGPTWRGTENNLPTAKLIAGEGINPEHCGFAIMTDNVTISNLWIQGFPDNGIGLAAGVSSVNLLNNYLVNNTKGIEIPSGDSVTDLTIQNNIIAGSTNQWGIRLSAGSAGEITIVNNIVYNNSVGIMVFNGTYATIKNNIIANHTGSAFSISGTNNLTESYNAAYSNDSNNGGAGDLNGIDCYLTDPDGASPNFSLKGFSRCIGAGESSSDIGALDYDGSRDTTIDVGESSGDISGAGALQTAVSFAASGDTISVAAGTYNGSITINKNLTLQGAGRGQSTLTNAGNHVINIPTGTYGTIIIDGFTIQNPDENKNGLIINDTNGVTISNLVVRNNTFDADGTGDRALNMSVNDISDLTIADLDVHNNIFMDSSDDCTTLQGVFTDADIYNNTFYNCGRSGISIRSATVASDYDIYNNIFHTIGITGASIELNSGTTNISHTFNDFFNGTALSGTGLSTGTGEITLNPYFVNAGTNCPLQNFSRAIDAGTADGTVASPEADADDDKTDLGYVEMGDRVTTIPVSASGTFTTLTAGLAYAASGDTISAAEGTYTENLTISTANTTLACASGTCVISGEGSPANNALSITANGVQVNGFTIRNGGTAGSYKVSASPLSYGGTNYTFTAGGDGAYWYPDDVGVTADATELEGIDSVHDFNVALCTTAGFATLYFTGYHANYIEGDGTNYTITSASEFEDFWNTEIGRNINPDAGELTCTCSYYKTGIFAANGANTSYTYAGNLAGDAGYGTATLVALGDDPATTPYLNYVSPNGGVSIANAGTSGSPVTLSNNTISSNGNGLMVSGTSFVNSNNNNIANNNSNNILSTGLSTGQLTLNYLLTVTVRKDDPSDNSLLSGVNLSYTYPTGAGTPTFSGNFSSSTDSNGSSTAYLAYQLITSSGTTDYSTSTYTISAAGAGSRTNTGTATINSINETLALTLDYTAPTSTSISINSGAASTDTTSVTLTLAAVGASHMMISNSSAFTGAEWETYATSKSWTLDSEMGTKTVYAKFKDTYGNTSAAVNDTITYLLPPPPSRYQPPSPPAQEPAPAGGPGPSPTSSPAEPAEETTPSEPPAGQNASPESSSDLTEAPVIPVAPEIADVAKEQKAQELLAKVAPAVSEDARPVLTTFLAYGNQATAEAAPQQRASLLRSFQRAFNDLPVTESHWSDITRIAQDELPKNRSLPQEAAQLATFVRLEKRLPASPDDWRELSRLTYGAPLSVKFNGVVTKIERDLDKERLAIGRYGKAYGVLPKTDAEWNVVASIAYD